jgi:hypothetical protein
VASRPGKFTISRSRTVAAPPYIVHAYVNDFRRWQEWSPWEKLDPTMKKDLKGAPDGVGAQYHWAGNKQVGEGEMTILETKPGQSVTILLEFLKPWKATNMAQFNFTPNGTGTNVTWTMTGTNGFMAKLFGLFTDMDKMIGPDFERGLFTLDTVTAEVPRGQADPMAAAKAAQAAQNTQTASLEPTPLPPMGSTAAPAAAPTANPAAGSAGKGRMSPEEIRARAVSPGRY